MKNFIFRVVILAFIVCSLLIIFVSIKENVINEKSSRAAATDSSLFMNGSLKSSGNMNGYFLDPTKVLDEIKRANGKSIEDAYKIYEEQKVDWSRNEPELSRHLIKYFDSYFELRLAIFFCIEHKMPIKKVINLKENKIDWNDSKSTKDAKKDLRENEFYKNNKYLLGEKTFNKGLSECITYIADLKNYMQKYKEVHAEIPAADLIMMIYQYIFEIDKTNDNIQFVNLALNYESSVARKIHKSNLTEKDVLVLELKEAYRLIQAANESIEKKRKADCTEIMKEIDRMFNEYSQSISDQGKYKEGISFLNRVKQTAMDIQQSPDKWYGNNEDQNAAIKFLKNKDNIPYMN